MRDRLIRVTTPSRLHFGLFSIGPFGPLDPAGTVPILRVRPSKMGLSPLPAPISEMPSESVRRFGGVGAMISQPGISLTIKNSRSLEATGPLAARAVQFARRVGSKIGLKTDPACRIDIVSASREHIGLGTGTQLGLAVALGVQALYGRLPGLPAEQARFAGRGERSAIGTHGFAMGGLLVEAGKRSAEEISPLVARVEMPLAWRFLLLLPTSGVGVHGDEERQAFAQLPAVPRSITAELTREALLDLLPAAAEGDFAAFSRSLFLFGQTAGNCFEAAQHGAFHSPRAAELIATLRQAGVEGVGQSSWGPTLFALLPDEPAAETLADQLRSQVDLHDYECVVAAPNNQGAQLEID